MTLVLSILVFASLLPALTAKGTVYTRWGNSGCGYTAATVYSGYMGGSWYTDPGAGANYLCLPPNPETSNIERPSDYSHLGGTEYKVSNRPERDQDALCAVCFVDDRSTNIMVPGTNKCPSGWSSEYTGFLMSGYRGHGASTEFICVDSKMESRVGSGTDQGGRLLYMVASICGSLPCPPYLDKNILQCVVCTK
ncbi:short-chain collagen C4-like isoform X2 [Pomacea canaliculata]|uniref:short-chain collagen C4-like isoform X2 n=1 Tax=Pomacea canaliculata TaxID=400727 RepID=UPI000D72747C|nr:short-chain collagen C4-like isoform X2 [Pomacea canaliculata]XP_025077077.1 short-chain collagen C4-like isoform X2 [Pomacea canaliculata]